MSEKEIIENGMCDKCKICVNPDRACPHLVAYYCGELLDTLKPKAAAELVSALVNKEYTTLDEVEAILDQMQTYPMPFIGSFEDHIEWVEFCRALNDMFVGGDFSIGDEFTINGCSFVAGTIEQIVSIFGNKS